MNWDFVEGAQPNHAYCTAYKTNAINTNVVNWKSLNSIKSTTQPFRCLFFYLESIRRPSYERSFPRHGRTLVDVDDNQTTNSVLIGVIQ